MLEDELPLLPMLYAAIRTTGNPLDMAVGANRDLRRLSAVDAVDARSNPVPLQPLSSRPPDVPSFV